MPLCTSIVETFPLSEAIPWACELKDKANRNQQDSHARASSTLPGAWHVMGA